MKTHHLLLLAPLLGMSKCDRDLITLKKEPLPVFTLPPITQSGANTLGFIIDGRVWRDYGVSCQTFRCDSNKVKGIYTTTGRQFSLYAGLSAEGIGENFTINLAQIQTSGVYLSNAAGTNSPLFTATRHMAFSNGPYNDFLVRRNTTTINVSKLDTVQHIIAGTFNGILYNRADSTKSVTISDGRFDVRYRP